MECWEGHWKSYQGAVSEGEISITGRDITDTVRAALCQRRRPIAHSITFFNVFLVHRTQRTFLSFLLYSLSTLFQHFATIFHKKSQNFFPNLHEKADFTAAIK